MKFYCRFSPSTSVHLEVSDTAPPSGTPPNWSFRYQGSVTGKHARNYQKWLHEVNQQVADKWAASFMYVLPDKKGRPQLWAYHPGKSPTLINSSVRRR